MHDYDGDMDYFQRQVAAKGYTKEEVDMDNYRGFTAIELQAIVNSLRKKGDVNEKH